MKKSAEKPKAPATENVSKIELSKFAHNYMIEYAVGVNEDRAVPDVIDGFKPVHRRLMWCAYTEGIRHSGKVQKSARLVGTVIAKFHPHGDVAAYQAAVNMVNARYRLFDKEGNFGSLIDPSFAAQRYTNLKLSKFSELVFFDPFYLPMLKFVPNYDAQEKEPVKLIALLPNLLLNSTAGIGVGLTSGFPKFTLQSVVKTLQHMLTTGEEATPKMAAKMLEFTTLGGGVLAPDQRSAVLSLFKKGSGKLVYDSVYELHTGRKEIHFTRFAPFANFDKRFEKLAAVAEVKHVNDMSCKEDKYARVAVFLKASVSEKSMPQVAKKLSAIMRESENYTNNVTVRTLKKDKDEPNVMLRSTTIPEILNKWVAYRIGLELKACEHSTKVTQLLIRRLQVMLLAVKHRDLIIKALSKKLNDADLAKLIAQYLKISVEEANLILDLKVRKLKALEGDDLSKEIAENKKKLVEYEARLKKPKPYIVQHLNTLLSSLKDYT